MLYIEKSYDMLPQMKQYNKSSRLIMIDICIHIFTLTHNNTNI